MRERKDLTDIIRIIIYRKRDIDEKSCNLPDTGVVCHFAVLGLRKFEQGFCGNMGTYVRKNERGQYYFLQRRFLRCRRGRDWEWSVVDGTLKVLGPYGGQFWSHDNIIGSYSIKGNTLTITDARIDGIILTLLCMNGIEYLLHSGKKILEIAYRL